MRHLLPLVLGMALAPLGVSSARTEAFIVTYVEVAPAAKTEAAALLRQLAAASRADAGSVRFEALQRIDRPHHFAILEVWQDAAAQATHASAPHTKQFRERLSPLLSAPYDERPHGGLAVGAAREGAGGVYAVTHVDFIPPRKDDGIAALSALVEPSRRDAGNLRFDVLQQSSRPNHLTVVEVWRDQAALDAHAVAAHTKKFREQLLPMSGSLFDERLYTALR